MNIDELIELVKLHGKSIYGFCYKLTGNKEETDDLYQEIFLRTVEQRLKINTSYNPKAYLLSIAVRVYIPDDGIALIFAGRGLDEKIVIGQVPDFAFHQRRRHSELLRDLMDGMRLEISRVNDILRQGASKKMVQECSEQSRYRRV